MLSERRPGHAGQRLSHDPPGASSASSARTAPGSPRSCEPSPRSRKQTPERRGSAASICFTTKTGRAAYSVTSRKSSGSTRRSAPSLFLDHLATLKGITDAKERKEIVLGLLRKTNLFDVRKRALGTYSGGMKQRFGIAQALLGNPRLVIVDEPTAGLDP